MLQLLIEAYCYACLFNQPSGCHNIDASYKAAMVTLAVHFKSRSPSTGQKSEKIDLS